MSNDPTWAEVLELSKKATPGPWEYINAEQGGHHFQFIRAPEAVIENTRGPSYATQIMSDENYPTKDADGDFIVAAVNYIRSCESADADGEAGGGSAHLNSPATAGDGWRDIASAPRDGTWVLLHSPKWPITCYPLVGWSDGPGEEWQFPAHPQWAPEMPWPTHWMMLPAPPSPVLGDGGEG